MYKSVSIVFGILLAAVVSQAELITSDPSSPYSILKYGTDAERAEIISSMESMIAEGTHSDEEVRAMNALISENPEVSGPEVLEVLDADFVSWFYGYENEEQEHSDFEPLARLSTTPNTKQCMKYRLCVVVSKAKQRIYAYENGVPIKGIHNQPVSTARRGKTTPNGIFTVEEIAGVNRYSGRYKGAYLGYAMQIHGHIFLHATSKDQYSKLGSRASAGCVRMHLNVARQLNNKMRQVGRKGIRVVVSPN